MKVEVIADLTCPWAYIGWHRLLQAISKYELSHPIAIELIWRPYYLLDSTHPIETKISATQRKKGKAMTAQYMPYAAKKLAQEGLRFTSKGPIGPTNKAHLLLDHIASHHPDKLCAAISALYDEFFGASGNIFEVEPLLTWSVKFGLAEDEVRQVLCDEIHQGKVDQSAASTMSAFNGVPIFVFEHITLDGVQEIETLSNALIEATKSTTS